MASFCSEATGVGVAVSEGRVWTGSGVGVGARFKVGAFTWVLVGSTGVGAG